MKTVKRKIERQDLINAATNIMCKLKVRNDEKFNLLNELTGRIIRNHDEVTLEEWYQFQIQLALNLYKDTIPNDV